MAERALHAHRLDVAGAVESARHADYGVELEERERRRRIVEIDPARPDLRLQLPGQRVRVHLEADRESRLRAHTRTDAAVFRAGERLVQSQSIAPPGLVAEGIETKYLPAPINRARRMVAGLPG